MKRTISHENKPAHEYFTEEEQQIFDERHHNDLTSLRLAHFQEYTSRDGSYKFFKLFIEDKEAHKTYSIKVTRSMLFKLIYDTLNCEEFKNVF